MQRSSNLVLSAIVALGLVASPLHVHAAVATAEPTAEGDTPDSLSTAAVEAFNAREFDRAIELFERAYSLDPQPNYLFNIGRVYEEKGDLNKAVANYQQFVQQPGVDIEARAVGPARLKVLRQTLAQLREDEPDAPKATPTDAPDPAEQAAAARKRKMRIAGYSLLGVGGGALVIGAVFGGLAIGKSNDAKDAAFIDDKLSLRQEAKGRAVVGDGLLITGGVLAGVGLVLVLTTLAKGRNKANVDAKAAAHRTRAIAWRPAVGTRGAGLSLAGSF